MATRFEGTHKCTNRGPPPSGDLRTSCRYHLKNVSPRNDRIRAARHFELGCDKRSYTQKLIRLKSVSFVSSFGLPQMPTSISAAPSCPKPIGIRIFARNPFQLTQGSTVVFKAVRPSISFGLFSMARLKLPSTDRPRPIAAFD